MRPLLVQIEREFWEHRALWIAPLAIAGLLLLGAALFGLVQIDVGDIGPPGLQLEPFEALILGWGVPFYLATAILVSVYFLDCLYGERRDRSILFWKSLPVSDLRSVLVKFAVGIVIVPIGTYLLVAASSLIVSVILLLRFRHEPMMHAAFQWNTLTWLHLQLVLLYGVGAALLWYAPYAAYLMLASAWARRSVYAWAFIPPVLLALVERMIFGTDYVGHIVQRGFGELMRLAFHLNAQIAISIGEVFGPRVGGGGGRGPGRMLLQPLDPSDLLSSPQLWLGLVAAALMLALAVRLRRYRDDS